METKGLIGSAFSYIANLQSDAYKKYVDLFRTYCLSDFAKKRRARMSTSSFTTTNEEGQTIKVYFPKYVNVQSKIDDLKSSITRTSTQQQIDSVNRQVAALSYYLEIVNSDPTNNILTELRKLELKTVFESAKADLKHLIDSVYDPVNPLNEERTSVTRDLLKASDALYTKKELVRTKNVNDTQAKQLYKSMVAELTNIVTFREQLNELTKSYIDFYIAELPRFELQAKAKKTVVAKKKVKVDEDNDDDAVTDTDGAKSDVDEAPKRAVKAPKKRTSKKAAAEQDDGDVAVPKKKVVKKTKVTKEDTSDSGADRNEKIKNAAKEKLLSKGILSKFAFKNKSECNSKNSKASYYISVKDLKDTIANDPELKKAFPANFKKMKKEELCDVFFN